MNEHRGQLDKYGSLRLDGQTARSEGHFHQVQQCRHLELSIFIEINQ
jgi:hypothetical protein